MVAATQKVPTKQHFETVIVGAGAAGLLLAARLAEAGQQVLVLEAGPERTLAQLTSSQIWARRLKWAGPHVEEDGNHKIGHAFNAGWGTGGSALHHYAVWLRLHERDFSVASDSGVGLDWPIKYEDLRAHYDRVQREVGISGDANAEIWRPKGEPYPMPALPVFAQGQVLQKGFDALGFRTSPIPLAINSQPYNGRASCLYDGWCDAGCPNGALANPLVTWLPRAKAAGAQLIHDAYVRRVLRSANNPARISGVEFVHQDATHTIAADRVIIAAFTVQSTRILLNSADDDNPAPGNRHDQLGRYLMSHPAATVFGMMAAETYPHQGASGGQLLCHDLYDSPSDKLGASQWLIANAIKPHDLLGYGTSRPDIIGDKLNPWMQRAARHLANMNIVVEDIADPDNRIRLSANKDQTGAPLAHTTHDLGTATNKLWETRVAQSEAIMRAAGATEVWHGPKAPMHLMGGTVMGRDPHHSVTDSYGRVHDTDNLYVSGPSLFPGTGAVNPTFTISALASRQADFLSKLA